MKKSGWGDSIKSETGLEKILLIVFASIVAAVSLFLFVIYASLGVEVIGYTVAPDRSGITGISAAVSIVLMTALLVGMIITFLGGAAVFVVSRKATGRAKTFVNITFIYHVSVVVLSIITLVVLQILC